MNHVGGDIVTDVVSIVFKSSPTHRQYRYRNHRRYRHEQIKGCARQTLTRSILSVSSVRESQNHQQQKSPKAEARTTTSKLMMFMLGIP